MIQMLKETFQQQQTRIERYKAHKSLVECKMSPSSSVNAQREQEYHLKHGMFKAA